MIAAAHCRSILAALSSWSDSTKPIFYRKSSMVKQMTRWCCGSAAGEMCSRKSGAQGSGTAIPVTLLCHFCLPWLSFAMNRADTWLCPCCLVSTVLSLCSDIRCAESSLLGNKPTLKKFGVQGWLAYIHYPPTCGIKNAPYLPCGCHLDWRWQAVLLWNPP